MTRALLKILFSLTLATLLALTQSANAKPPKYVGEGNTVEATDALYQIELIAYTHFTEAGFQSESWSTLAPPELSNPDIYRLTPESPGRTATAKHYYTLLPHDYFILTDTEARLAKQNDYTPVFHITWQMPESDLRAGRLIHLYGGPGYDDNGVMLLENKNGNLPYLQSSFWMLDGLMSIRLKRYFEVGFNLRLNVPLTTITEIDPEFITEEARIKIISFPFTQHRRMRSDELNLVGHPLFGVFIQVHKLAPDMRKAFKK